MTGELTTVDEQVPVVGVSYQIAVGEGRQLVFQTHVDRDVSDQDLNELLDRVARAADRQEARREIETLQENIDHVTQALDRLTHDLNDLDRRSQEAWSNKNKHGDWEPERLSAQERQNRNNVITGIDRHVVALKKDRERMERLKGMVNGNASNLATDLSARSADR